MILEGTINVRAPRVKVWDFLLDVDQLTSCIPALEEVTKIDDKSFTGVIVVTVGPISGRFNFNSTILNTIPLEQLTTLVSGDDSVTGSKVTVNVSGFLTENIDHTQLRYHATVEIKGRIAILGDMVIRATSSLILNEFTSRLRQQLEANEKPGIA